jgi:hypothetical protein
VTAIRNAQIRPAQSAQAQVMSWRSQGAQTTLAAIPPDQPDIIEPAINTSGWVRCHHRVSGQPAISAARIGFSMLVVSSLFASPAPMAAAMTRVRPPAARTSASGLARFLRLATYSALLVQG